MVLGFCSSPHCNLSSLFKMSTVVLKLFAGKVTGWTDRRTNLIRSGSSKLIRPFLIWSLSYTFSDPINLERIFWEHKTVNIECEILSFSDIFCVL